MFKTKAEEELGFKKREFKSWLSERTIKKIEEKQSIKTLPCKNTNAETDRISPEKLRRVPGTDKRDLVDKLAKEAETATQQNNIRTLYNITCQLSSRRVHTNKPVRESNGTILSKT